MWQTNATYNPEIQPDPLMNTVTQLTEGIQGSGPAQRAQVLGPPTPAGRGKERDTTGGQDWVLWNRKFKKKKQYFL